MTTHTLGLTLTTSTIGTQGSANNPIDNAWHNPTFWTGIKYHTWTNNCIAGSSPLWVQNTTTFNPSNNGSSNALHG